MTFPQTEFQTLPPGVADVLEEEAHCPVERPGRCCLSCARLSEQGEVRLGTANWLAVPEADLVMPGLTDFTRGSGCPHRPAWPGGRCVIGTGACRGSRKRRSPEALRVRDARRYRTPATDCN